MHIFELAIWCADWKTEKKMNRPLHFGQTIPNLSKTLMYVLHYYSMETKDESKVKLCNIVKDFLVYEREDKDLYKNIEKDVGTKFHRSWYLKDDTRLLSVDKKKKVNERWAWWKIYDGICCQDVCVQKALEKVKK